MVAGWWVDGGWWEMGGRAQMGLCVCIWASGMCAGADMGGARGWGAQVRERARRRRAGHAHTDIKCAAPRHGHTTTLL